MTRPTWRCAAPLMLTLLLSGCMTWRPATIGPRQLIEQEDGPLTVRVTRRDGERTVVRNPRISNDSIAVVAGPCRQLSARGGRFLCPTVGVVPLEDVREMETREAARGPAFMVLASLALVAVFAPLRGW